MGKKKKKKGSNGRKTLLPEGRTEGIRRRLIASKAYYSGQIETLRQDALKNGAVPWKILRYQRVVSPKDIPILLRQDAYVLPGTFEKHLNYISRECHPMRLSDLIELIDDYQEIPDKAVVITFDGGHMDNYLNAFPLLLKHRIPATFFLPTAYPESNSFFYNDRIVLCLSILQKHSVALPSLDFLPEQVVEILKKVSPDSRITPELVGNLVLGLEQANSNQRSLAMAALAEVVLQVDNFPDYEDFIRWQDARHLQEMGFTLGVMGHESMAHPQMEQQEFKNDVIHSLMEFEREGIAPEPVLGLPPRLLTPEIVEATASLDFRYALDISSFPEPRFQIDLPMMLGRIPIFEGASFCTELFACRLWELEISGISY